MIRPPSGVAPERELGPLMVCCVPFSTEVVQYSDSSVLTGTCSGVAREGRDDSKAAHLWQDILVNSDTSS